MQTSTQCTSISLFHLNVLTQQQSGRFHVGIIVTVCALTRIFQVLEFDFEFCCNDNTVQLQQHTMQMGWQHALLYTNNRLYTVYRQQTCTKQSTIHPYLKRSLHNISPLVCSNFSVGNLWMSSFHVSRHKNCLHS